MRYRKCNETQDLQQIGRCIDGQAEAVRETLNQSGLDLNSEYELPTTNIGSQALD